MTEEGGASHNLLHMRTSSQEEEKEEEGEGEGGSGLV